MVYGGVRRGEEGSIVNVLLLAHTHTHISPLHLYPLSYSPLTNVPGKMVYRVLRERILICGEEGEGEREGGEGEMGGGGGCHFRNQLRNARYLLWR